MFFFFCRKQPHRVQFNSICKLLSTRRVNDNLCEWVAFSVYVVQFYILPSAPCSLAMKLYRFIHIFLCWSVAVVYIIYFIYKHSLNARVVLYNIIMMIVFWLHICFKHKECNPIAYGSTSKNYLPHSLCCTPFAQKNSINAVEHRPEYNHFIDSEFHKL